MFRHFIERGMLALMLTWPTAFGITLGIEALVLLAFFRGQAAWWRILLAALAANLCTHPLVWFVIPSLVLKLGSFPALDPIGTYIVVAELFALAAEVPVLVLLLRPDPWYRAASASALANSASYCAGLTLYLALG